MKVMLDPGHGGADPGAVNAELGLRESVVAMKYATGLWAALKPRHEVSLTRKTDRYVSLQNRVRIAKEFEADLFLSIHLNSAENPLATGFEVWTSVGQTLSDAVASSIFYRIRHAFPALARRADWSDGDPDKERNYYVLRKTPMPAVLVELGFICNPDEARWLTEVDTMKRYVRAIVAGVG